jgi:O-antigen ligase
MTDQTPNQSPAPADGRTAALDAFGAQFNHSLGRFGYPFHLFAAILWCFSAFGPRALVELGMIPLAVLFLARTPFILRGVLGAFTFVASACLLIWALWSIVTVAWTPDLPRAAHELRYLRWLWIPLALWPVMDRRPALVRALCLGLTAALLAQALDYLAVRSGRTLFSHPPAPDHLARVSGWWHQPAVGGVMLVAGLGIHVGPALLGAGRTRLLGAIGSAACLVALVLTGSRGSWLAALLLIALALLAALALLRPRRRALAAAAAVLAALVLLVGAIASPLGAPVRGRAASLVHQSRDALSGRVDSDVGGRVVAAKAALHAIARRPLEGQGRGSFPTALTTFIADRKIDIAPERLDHLQTAHNTWLNETLAGGLLGSALLALAWLAAVLSGFQGPSPLAARLGSYDAAPALGLFALALASPFETITLNMNTMALLCTLIALCPQYRPAPRPGFTATPTA